MTTRRRLRWIAVALGLAVGVVPTAGLNLLLWFHVRSVGQENIGDSARTMLQLAESHLDAAMTALVAISLHDVGCAPQDLAVFRQTLLKISEVSEIGVVSANTAAACTTGADLPRVVRPLSPENDTLMPRIKLAVDAIGEGDGERLIELTWRGDHGAMVRFLIPGRALMPAIVIGRLQADFVTRLMLVDGTAIAQRRVGSATAPEGGGPAAYQARLLSDRYPLALVAAVRTGDLWASYRDIFLYANLGGLGLTVLIVLGALVVARRLEGPAREIDDALRRGEFIPYYQPVVDIATGRLMGCEVLARRRLRDGTILSPATFVPICEATGQIFAVTRVLMVHARDELGLLYADRPHLKAAFNLVAGHFANFDIVGEIRDIFHGSPFRPQQLVFEVTERQPLPDLARASAVIARLQALGVRVALDDVGTGHGGLSYLMKLGVDQVKIDKMFVDAIGTDRYSATIVDTLIKLAADLAMEVVAEGVETEVQMSYLRAHGVHAAQGYLFAPPLPGSAYCDLVAAMEPHGQAGEAAAVA